MLVIIVLQAAAAAATPLLKTPLSTAQQASYAAAASYTAVAARAYGAAAAAAQPVAGYAAVAGWVRTWHWRSSGLSIIEPVYIATWMLISDRILIILCREILIEKWEAIENNFDYSKHMLICLLLCVRK